MKTFSGYPLQSLSWCGVVVLGLVFGLTACATRPPAEGHSEKAVATLSLSLPQDAGEHRARSSPPRKQIVIQVGKEGNLTVDGSRCQPEQLARKLERLAQRGPFRVLIRVSGESAMARCLLVIDACRSAGIEHMSLMSR